MLTNDWWQSSSILFSIFSSQWIIIYKKYLNINIYAECNVLWMLNNNERNWKKKNFRHSFVQIIFIFILFFFFVFPFERKTRLQISKEKKKKIISISFLDFMLVLCFFLSLVCLARDNIAIYLIETNTHTSEELRRDHEEWEMLGWLICIFFSISFPVMVYLFEIKNQSIDKLWNVFLFVDCF